MDQKEQKKKFDQTWAKIVAKAWGDELFMQRVLKHPKEVLKDYGVVVPNGWELKVEKAQPKVIHLFIPPKPALSHEDLENVSGGVSFTWFTG